MSIKQFNCEYLSKEDRLVFRVNTVGGDEFALLFTRRVTVFILKATQELALKTLERQHTAPMAQTMVEFETEAARAQTQFHNQYDGGAHAPLGHVPLLVHDVRCQIVEQEGVAKISMDFHLENNKFINLQLWGNVLQNMRILLERMLNHASWNLSFSEFDQISKPDLSTATPQFH